MKKQFLWILTAQVIASALSALSYIWLGRLVGVEQVGVIGVVTSIMAFVVIVADFGMASYIARERAVGHEVAVVDALRLNTLSTIVFGVAAVLVLGALWLAGGVPASLALLALALVIEKNTNTALAVPVADRKSAVPVISTLIRRVIAFGLFAVANLVGIDAVTGFSVASLIAAIVGQAQLRLWLSSRIDGGISRWRDAPRAAVHAWPFLVSNASAHVRTLDTSIVAAVASTYAAGLYAAATRIVNPFYLLPSALANVVMPHSARQDAAGARRLALRVTALFLALVVPLGVVALFARPIVVFLMGDAFAEAAPVLAAMLVGLPFVALSSPLGSILQSQGHQHAVSLNGAIFAVVVIAAIVVGALVAGPVGAAIALGAAYLAKSASLVVIILRRLR